MLALAFFRNLTERSGVKFLKKEEKQNKKKRREKRTENLFRLGGAMLCIIKLNKLLFIV